MIAPFARQAARDWLKGSVSVLIRIKADTRDMANAKALRTIGMGCGLKPLPIPNLAELAKELEAALPELGAGLPPLGSGLPPLGSGLPPLGSGLPQLPKLPSGLPPFPSGLPPLPKIDIQVGKPKDTAKPAAKDAGARN
jgi:hypothetical protein